MTRAVIRKLAAAAMVVWLAGCGSGDTELTAGDLVVPSDALAKAPLHPMGGVPIAADSDHVWLSDFDQLAVYSRADERWKLAEMPWEPQLVASLNLTAADGILYGLARICPSDCLTLNDGGEDGGAVDIDLAAEAFTVVEADDGEPQVRSLGSDDGLTIPFDSTIKALPSREGRSRLLVENLDSMAVVSIDADGATIEHRATFRREPRVPLPD
jgi:hypothetical protein